jgi:hypothetical protein
MIVRMLSFIACSLQVHVLHFHDGSRSKSDPGRVAKRVQTMLAATTWGVWYLTDPSHPTFGSLLGASVSAKHVFS